MASRSRSIVLAVLVLVALVAYGLYYLSSNLNGIVAGVIEEQGSAATQTAVKVEGVDIRLTDSSAALAGLSVANPEGFSGNAIELGALSVALDVNSITSDAIVIKDIVVDGARVNLVQQGTQNNLKQLLDNLKQLQSGEQAPASEEPGKRLIIDRFVLDGASASVTLPGVEGTREVELPQVVVNDIGRASNGATGAQVAQQLLRPLLEAAITSAAGQAVKDKAKEKIDEALGGFMNKLSGKKDEG